MNTSSEIRFCCPNCTQSLQAEVDMIGETVDCPACNKPLLIPQVDPIKQSNDSTFISLDPAFITFPCPKCERELFANLNFIDKEINCRHCHARALVPRQSIPTNEIDILRRLEDERRRGVRTTLSITQDKSLPIKNISESSAIILAVENPPDNMNISPPIIGGYSSNSIPYESTTDSASMLRGMITILQLLGLCLHIWTTVIAYQIDGTLGAIVSFIFPLLSEAFYFITMINKTEFFNPYSTALMAYAFCYGFAFFIFQAISKR